MHWNAPQRPAEYAENSLRQAILEGDFPIGVALPAERELAAQLGVTRPTLREALQRLSRDGWIEIRQGKPTRVRDYWQEGSLGLLASLARAPAHHPPGFIDHLLEARAALAPAYTRLAVAHQAGEVAALLGEAERLSDRAADYAAFDWRLQHRLTVLSGNPIFTLILNGFRELYLSLALQYFAQIEARRESRAYYAALRAAALAGDLEAAERLTREVMARSRELWRQVETATHAPANEVETHG